MAKAKPKKVPTQSDEPPEPVPSEPEANDDDITMFAKADTYSVIGFPDEQPQFVVLVAGARGTNIGIILKNLSAVSMLASALQHRANEVWPETKK